MSFAKRLEYDLSSAYQRLINSRMELKFITKPPEQQPAKTQKVAFPADYLLSVELLPDGSSTNKQDVWLQSWADFTRREVSSGRIKLHEVPEYDPETGQVPNTFIHSVYMKNRKLN